MFEAEELVVQSDAPLKVASTNFESRRIQRLNENMLCVKPTLLSLAYSGVFVFLGCVLVGLWGAQILTTFEGPGSLPLAFIGLLFISAGMGIYYTHNEQVLVARDQGVQFRRSWRLGNISDNGPSYKTIDIRYIEKIQLLSHSVKHRTNRNKRRSTYVEFQVNVCCAEQDRYNLFITKKSDQAEKFANQVSALLDVPLVRL